MGSRRVDIVVARAIHLAMAARLDRERAASELIDLSGGSWAVLNAARLRVDRALDYRWSAVAARASDALAAAIDAEGSRLPTAS